MERIIKRNTPEIFKDDRRSKLMMIQETSLENSLNILFKILHESFSLLEEILYFDPIPAVPFLQQKKPIYYECNFVAF